MAAAGDKSNDTHPPLGAIIAEKYRVERVLGVGGMGVVVAARQLHLEREVAIKCLLPQAAGNPEAVARFLREGKAAALLKSEHVVRVFDVGLGDLGHVVGPYMVMEFLAGEDLSTTLETRGPLPLGEAAELLLQACEAVGEAHAAGIVHRDLKPANLFVIRRPDGSPFIKVLDFGISKIVDEVAEAEAQSLTGTRSTLGTPVYMSPEQVRSAKKVDARTDIWALGSILQELLTGNPPFDAPTLTSLCAMIIADEPAPLREFCPDIPPEIDELVAACLQKDVSRRIQSVSEFASILAPFANRSSLFALASTVEGGLPPRSTSQRTAPSLRALQTNVETVAQDSSIPRSASGIRAAPRITADSQEPAADTRPAASEPAASLQTSMGPATVSVPASARRRPVGALAAGAVALLALIGLGGWKLSTSTPPTPPATSAAQGSGQPTAPPGVATGQQAAASGAASGAGGAVSGVAGAPAALGTAAPSASAAPGATAAGGPQNSAGGAGNPAGAGGPVASHGPGLRRPGKPPGPAITAYDPSKELSPK